MLMLAVLSQLVAPAIAGPVVVETATGDAEELAVAATVRRLIDEHDISNWMFTDRIVVDREARIPHSHPVLTINTNYRDEDNEILGYIFHEQLHWLVLSNQSALGAAIREMRDRYPNAPRAPRPAHVTSTALICISLFARSNTWRSNRKSDDPRLKNRFCRSHTTPGSSVRWSMIGKSCVKSC
jgi:hypothetical protein